MHKICTKHIAAMIMYIVINFYDLKNLISYSNQLCDQNLNHATLESSNEGSDNDYADYLENEEERNRIEQENFYISDEESDEEYSDSSNEEQNDEEQILYNNDIGNDQPLYRGAGITVRGSMLIILTLLLHHNLTMTCIEDIILALQ